MTTVLPSSAPATLAPKAASTTTAAPAPPSTTSSSSQAPSQAPPPTTSSVPQATPQASTQVAYAPRTVAYICPYSKVHLIAIARAVGCHALYEYNDSLQNFVFHKCHCQAKTLERDLYPRYAVYYAEIKKHVIFAWNMITCQVEQYVFVEQHGGFEQVHLPSLIYDANMVTRSTTVAVIQCATGGTVVLEKETSSGTMQKVQQVFGRLMVLPPAQVNTLMAKELTKIEKALPKGAYSTKTPFIIRYCAHLGKDIVLVKGPYLRFAFDYAYHGKFYTYNCSLCAKQDVVSEEDLIPKYAEFYAPIKTYVIHCKNVKTGCMEQYVYEGDAFKQVDYSELIYDSGRDSYSTALFVLTGGSTVVVERDDDGHFKKEKWCMASGGFQTVPEMAVKTLEIQKQAEATSTKKASSKAPESPYDFPLLRGALQKIDNTVALSPVLASTLTSTVRQAVENLLDSEWIQKASESQKTSETQKLMKKKKKATSDSQKLKKKKEKKTSLEVLTAPDM